VRIRKLARLPPISSDPILATSMDTGVDVLRQSTVARRAVLSAVLLGFIESVFVYQTGRASPGILPAIFVPHLLLALISVAAASALMPLFRRLAVARAINTSMLASFLLLAAPVLLLAFRGGEPLAPTPLLPTWTTWGISAAIILVAAVSTLRSRQYLGTPHTTDRFFATAFFVYTTAVAALALRTIDARGWTSAGWFRSVTGIGVALFVAVVGGYSALRKGRDSWRRVFVVVVWIVTLAGAVASRKLLSRPVPLPQTTSRGANSTKTPLRGILLITVDTLRRDHVSVYEPASDTTPRLQAFARTAQIFDKAYASAPYTLSSHASLFTGLPPHAHGAHADSSRWRAPLDFPLAGDAHTLAQILSERGYRTAGIAANFGYLATWTGLGRGFDEYVATAKHYLSYYPTFLPLQARFDPGARNAYTDAWTADNVTDAAIAWLDRRDNASFFLFINYLDAHEYLNDVAPSQVRRVIDPEMSSRAALLSAYDKRIRFTDHEIGRLLDWLSSHGLFDDALIVITSDHGEYFGEHELWGHGIDLHEPVLRIPLLVKFAGPSRPDRTEVRVSHEQVFALMRSLALGATPEAALAELPRNEPRVIAESWNTRRRRQRWPRISWPVGRAVYSGRWKLIERLGGTSELFDLDKDPAENDNLLRSQPVAAQNLAADLISKLPPLQANPSRSNVPQVLDSEATEGLRALGYVGP
jgi:arylsulfatase A-like enzyme